MNKVAILIFALTITHTLGQTCDNNDIADHFTDTTLADNAGAYLAAPGHTSAIKSCTSLLNKRTCCVDAYFDTFEAKANTLKDTIETAVIARDTAILAARKAVGGASANAVKFAEAIAAAAPTITKWTTALPSGATFDETDLAGITTDAAAIATLFTDFYAGYEDRRTAFTEDYQASRADCVVELLKTEVSSWCTTCLSNEDRADYGVTVTSGVVTFDLGPTVLGRLAAACQPYFAASEVQTDVFTVFPYVAKLEAYTTALNKIAAETQAGVAEFQAITTTAPTDNQEVSSVPGSCTAQACTWIEGNLIEEGIINVDTLAVGGTTARRMLSEGRRLQGGSFEPSATEAKFTITFEDNPGDLDNPNDLSALRVGVFSCIVAFFVALLI